MIGPTMSHKVHNPASLKKVLCVFSRDSLARWTSAMVCWTRSASSSLMDSRVWRVEGTPLTIPAGHITRTSKNWLDPISVAVNLAVRSSTISAQPESGPCP